MLTNFSSPPCAEFIIEAPLDHAGGETSGRHCWADMLTSSKAKSCWADTYTLEIDLKAHMQGKA